MIGRVLLGRYRIVRELAKGGMGVVYLARAEGAVGFVKPVVIKLVLPEHAADERFRSMFVREAQILANLRHPGIVDVIELNEEDGAYVMVLEYVRGYHLGQWSKFLRLKGRALAPGIAIQIVIDVLEALYHAHSMAHPDGTSMHIVHRDVSPSNILLDEDGRARLLDFGVARMRGGTAEYMTQVKGFVGKLFYSAPEVFAEGGDATPKSDAYACAVMLHELLTGQNPFRTDSQAQTLQRVLTHMPEPLEASHPELPHGLDAVLAKALAKSPDDRYDSALDFAHALRSLQTEGESEQRKQLAAMLRGDFGREMSELLGLESLADRDDAWRRLNTQRPDNDGTPLPEHGLVLEQLYGRSDTSTGSGTGSGSGQSSPGAAGESTLAVRGTSRPKPRPSLPVIGSSPITAAPRRPARSRAARADDEPATPVEGLDRSPPAPMAAPAATSRQAHVPTVRIEPPSERGSSLSRVLIPALALGLGALGSYAYLARTDASAAAPQINVIAERTPVPASHPEPDLPSEPTPAADAGSPAPRLSSPKKARRERRPAASPGAVDPVALSAAFSAERRRIEACFNGGGVSVEGVATVSIAFEVDAKGRALRADVSPPAVASTELGRCLRRVGLGTSFPPGGRPVSFSIPVSARSARGR
jgi:eukaryotic-like serine/threonine-protein kinase